MAINWDTNIWDEEKLPPKIEYPVWGYACSRWVDTSCGRDRGYNNLIDAYGTVGQAIDRGAQIELRVVNWYVDEPGWELYPIAIMIDTTDIEEAMCMVEQLVAEYHDA